MPSPKVAKTPFYDVPLFRGSMDVTTRIAQHAEVTSLQKELACDWLLRSFLWLPPLFYPLAHHLAPSSPASARTAMAASTSSRARAPSTDSRAPKVMGPAATATSRSYRPTALLARRTDTIGDARGAHLNQTGNHHKARQRCCSARCLFRRAPRPPTARKPRIWAAPWHRRQRTAASGDV